MKVGRRAKLLSLGLILIFVLGLSWNRLVYRPPLLGERLFDPVGKIHDAVYFAWFYTRAFWESSGWEHRPDPVLAALSVWYRPEMSKELIGLDSDDLSALARLFYSLGLKDKAKVLFRFMPEPLPQRAAWLAQLGDWTGILNICGESDQSTRYWRARALAATGCQEQAISLFSDLPLMSDAQARLGLLLENSERGAACRSYRQALELDPDNLIALQGLARIGEPKAQKQAVAKLKKLEPQLKLNIPVGENFILWGIDIPPKKVESRAHTSLDLTLLGWWGKDVSLSPRAVLSSSADPYPHHQGRERFRIPRPGGAKKVRLSWNWPLEISPGLIDLGLEFIDPKTGCSLAILGKGTVIPVSQIELKPRLVSKKGDSFAVENARVLFVETWLGPGDRMRLEFQDPILAGMVVVGQGFRHPLPVRPGKRIGEVALETRKGTRHTLWLREGWETTDYRPGHIFGNFPKNAYSWKREDDPEKILYYPEVWLPGLEEIIALEATNLSAGSGLVLDSIAFGNWTDPQQTTWHSEIVRSRQPR